MRRILSIAVIFCLCCGAGPTTAPTTQTATNQTLRADAPPDVQKLAELTKRNRTKIIDLRRAQFKAATDEVDLRRSGVINSTTTSQKLGRGYGGAGDGFHVMGGSSSPIRWTFQSEDDKQKYITEAKASAEAARQALLAARKSPLVLMDSDDCESFGTGWIGHVSTARVFQVVDESDAIVRVSNVGPHGSLDVWIEGLDTSGLTDGQLYIGDVWITGTKSYDAIAGITTILKAEPFKIGDWLQGPG